MLLGVILSVTLAALFQRVASRMEADVQWARRTVNAMLTNAGRGHHVRTVLDQPAYMRPTPLAPPPYRNTGWDRMARPLPSSGICQAPINRDTILARS